MSKPNLEGQQHFMSSASQTSRKKSISICNYVCGLFSRPKNAAGHIGDRTFGTNPLGRIRYYPLSPGTLNILGGYESAYHAVLQFAYIFAPKFWNAEKQGLDSRACPYLCNHRAWHKLWPQIYRIDHSYWLFDTKKWRNKPPYYMFSF